MAKIKLKLEEFGNAYVGKIVAKKHIKHDELEELFFKALETELEELGFPEEQIELMKTVIRITFENPKIELPVVTPNKELFELVQEAVENAKEVALEEFNGGY
jgi:hypothetical protein